jgi:hypothetical protein
MPDVLVWNARWRCEKGEALKERADKMVSGFLVGFFRIPLSLFVQVQRGELTKTGLKTFTRRVATEEGHGLTNGGSRTYFVVGVVVDCSQLHTVAFFKSF